MASTNSGVQGTPPLLQETPVGDLLGEGVLEGVCELGEETCLVEELGGLQVGEATAERLLGTSAMAWRRGRGHPCR